MSFRIFRSLLPHVGISIFIEYLSFTEFPNGNSTEIVISNGHTTVLIAHDSKTGLIANHTKNFEIYCEINNSLL